MGKLVKQDKLISLDVHINLIHILEYYLLKLIY